MISEFLLSDAGEETPDLKDSNSHHFRDRKVLVVDDDVRNVFALCNVFEQEGIIVSVAQNGQECLELLAKDHEHRTYPHGYHDAGHGWL